MKSKVKFGIMECPKCDGGGLLRKVDPESLVQARLQAGVSLEKIADRLGLSANYLQKIEKGERNCTPRIEAAYAKL